MRRLLFLCYFAAGAAACTQALAEPYGSKEPYVFVARTIDDGSSGNAGSPQTTYYIKDIVHGDFPDHQFDRQANLLIEPNFRGDNRKLDAPTVVIYGCKQGRGQLLRWDYKGHKPWSSWDSKGGTVADAIGRTACETKVPR